MVGAAVSWKEDLETPLPRKVLFATREQMLAFAERGRCAMNPEDRQACEHGLSIGRGRIWLNLTAEQYATLLSLAAPAGKVIVFSPR
jgi:hypothetical protein